MSTAVISDVQASVTKKSQRNIGIDILRLICAFAIIIIHTPPPRNQSGSRGSH